MTDQTHAGALSVVHTLAVPDGSNAHESTETNCWVRADDSAEIIRMILGVVMLSGMSGQVQRTFSDRLYVSQRAMGVEV